MYAAVRAGPPAGHSQERQDRVGPLAIGGALLAACPFHRGVAGGAYTEEYCEAMLSRFARYRFRHPGVITIDGLSDLFVTTSELEATLTIHCTGLPVGLRDATTVAVVQLIHDIR